MNQAEPENNTSTTGAEEAGAEATATPPTGAADEECVDCLPRTRDDDFPFTGCGCGDCDSESIEILCQAEGIKARAAYDAANVDAPSPERYEQARLAYGTSRYAVTAQLDQLESDLDDAMHEIRCRIDDPDKVDCLEKSWRKLRRRLRDCRADGCCVERYEFHRAPKEAEVEELKAKAARYAYVTWHAATCFDRLAREPELLKQRVADLTTEVMAIYYQVFPEKAPPPAPVPAEVTTDTAAAQGHAGGAPADANQTGGDTQTKAAPEEETPPADKPDWPNLYAAGLVAQSHLEHVYWGFDDPEDLVRCLCRAMKVAMEGHAAIAELCGELRVREARWEERNKCCKRLKDHAAAEVLSGYVRCERGDPDTDDEPGCEDCDDDHDHHHDHDHRHDRGDRRRRRDHDDDDDDDVDVDVDVEVDVRVEEDDDRPSRRGRRRESDRRRDDDDDEDGEDDGGTRDRRRSSEERRPSSRGRETTGGSRR